MGSSGELDRLRVSSQIILGCAILPFPPTRRPISHTWMCWLGYSTESRRESDEKARWAGGSCVSEVLELSSSLKDDIGGGIFCILNGVMRIESMNSNNRGSSVAHTSTRLSYDTHHHQPPLHNPEIQRSPIWMHMCPREVYGPRLSL
jgi:hypothetical protein